MSPQLSFSAAVSSGAFAVFALAMTLGNMIEAPEWHLAVPGLTGALCAF